MKNEQWQKSQLKQSFAIMQSFAKKILHEKKSIKTAFCNFYFWLYPVTRAQSILQSIPPKGGYMPFANARAINPPGGEMLLQILL